MSFAPDEESPPGTAGGEAGPDGIGETEAPRPARQRRRRGRRGAGERPDPRLDERSDGEATAVFGEEESSVVEVEPDLEAAQQVEAVGVEDEAAPVAVVPQPPEGVAPSPVTQREAAPPVPGQPLPHPGEPRVQQRGRPQVHGPAAQPSPGRHQPLTGRGPRPQQPRPQALPPGVPSAAALDESEPARVQPIQRAEPQGDLALLLRGFEEIQQRNTDRLMAAIRQSGLASDGAAPRSLSVTERVGLFVDVPNLVYAARYLNRWIDFGRLLERLLGGRRLIRAHAYSPTDPDPSAEQQFLTPVKSQGYRLTTKNYRTFASGAKKADMDLDLCMDVVRLVVAKAIDCVVLCSGDGDFLPLLEFCSDNGVRVEVASFVEATSDELRQTCDRFYNLSAMEGIRLTRPLGATS